MTQEVRQENKMGTMPVGKLLFSMSVPMIISMLVMACYNVVDSIFVARINEEALTAVSLAFPIQNLMISIATGTAVGINALVSRSLGEKNFDKANNIARHGIFLAIASYIVFALVMLFVQKPFMMIQSGGGLIYEYGVTYLRIVCVLCIAVFMQVTFERLLSSTGKTHLTMISQITGAVINIIMDPILIFGIGPFPELGVAGAAAATVFGQIVGTIIALTFNLKFNKELNLNMRGFRPSGRIIGAIYAIGVPSIILAAVTSIMTFGMNLILKHVLASTTAIAVFGIFFKLNSIVCMPVFGLNNGLVPIVAYNYGARNKKRLMDTAKLSIITAMAIMICGAAVFWVFPEQLLHMFNASENMITIGVKALRCCGLSFVLAGYCIVMSSVCQALGSAVLSMLNSLMRQLIVLLPAAYILAKLGGLDAVWWSYAIAEVASFIFMTCFFIFVYRRKIKPLDQPAV